MSGISIRFFVVFLSVFTPIFTGCGGGSASSGFEDGTYTFTSSSGQIEADIDGFIVIDVLVNGVPGRFLLDTGAASFVVSPDFAARLNLELIGQGQVSTVVGTSPAEIRRINSIQVANIAGSEIDALVANLGDFDGVVGAPLFLEAIVTVDYANELVTFDDPSTQTTAALAAELGAEISPFRDFFIQDVAINGIVFDRLLVDTGSAGGINLSADQAEGLITEDTETIRTVVAAVNGTLSAVAFIADTIEIGSSLLSNQFVVVQQPELKHGLLGNLILKQFIVVFDASAGVIALRQDRAFEFGLARSEPGERSTESSDQLVAFVQ